MTWTLKVERQGKETVYKDYDTPSRATDAMLIAMDRMQDPVIITLMDPAGLAIAKLEIKPEGIQVGSYFIRTKTSLDMDPLDLKIVNP
jgi:hypothetical protein